MLFYTNTCEGSQKTTMDESLEKAPSETPKRKRKALILPSQQTKSYQLVSSGSKEETPVVLIDHKAVLPPKISRILPGSQFGYAV